MIKLICTLLFPTILILPLHGAQADDSPDHDFSGPQAPKPKLNLSHQIIEGERRKPTDLVVKDDDTGETLTLSRADVAKTIQTAAKTRKEKEKKAHTTAPLTSSKKIKVTKTTGTQEVDLYVLRGKEDRRKFRALAQNLFEQFKIARAAGTKNFDNIYVQCGPNKKTDIVEINKGLWDIAAAPLRLSGNPNEGYRVTNPPAYGSAVDNTSKAFKKGLRFVEGVRSETAKVLRHIAETDEEFIGSSRGGAKKLRGYDLESPKASAKDQRQVMNSFASLFIKKAENKEKLPTKEVALEEMSLELGTETESSASASKSMDDKSADLKEESKDKAKATEAHNQDPSAVVDSKKKKKKKKGKKG